MLREAHLKQRIIDELTPVLDFSGIDVSNDDAFIEILRNHVVGDTSPVTAMPAEPDPVAPGTTSVSH